MSGQQAGNERMITLNTWERNPQNPADEHDWIRYFDDHRKYRDARFVPGSGWIGVVLETLDGVE